MSLVKKTIETRLHVAGTPDVPDLVHPGDWISEDGIPLLVVRVSRRREGKWDISPNAESWTITYLGTGYLTGESISIHDCSGINGIVAVDGQLLPLYDLGWNKRSIQVIPKPEHITVPKNVLAFIGRNAQGKLF